MIYAAVVQHHNCIADVRRLFHQLIEEVLESCLLGRLGLEVVMDEAPLISYCCACYVDGFCPPTLRRLEIVSLLARAVVL